MSQTDGETVGDTFRSILPGLMDRVLNNEDMSATASGLQVNETKHTIQIFEYDEPPEVGGGRTLVAEIDKNRILTEEPEE